MVVSILRLLHFAGADESLLLRPAFINAFKTPFDTARVRRYRSAADKDPNRVCVGGGGGLQGYPTAAFDVYRNGQVADDAVRQNVGFGGDAAVDDDFQWDLAGVANAGGSRCQ